MSKEDKIESGLIALIVGLSIGMAIVSTYRSCNNKIIPITDKVQQGYVVPSKLEIKIEDLDKNGEDALYRVNEELGIKIYNLKIVHQADLDCKEKQRISWYKCERYEGIIQNNEAEELLWISLSESHMLTHPISRDAISKYLNK